MIKAFDVYAGTLSSKQLGQMVTSGYGAVFHYYSHNQNKTLTKQSAQLTTYAGLQLGVVWEAQGDSPSMFTSAYGQADAEKAIQEAISVGQPKGSAIYFAVDFGPTVTQIQNNIIPYFTSVSTFIRSQGYKVGAYACGDALVALFKAGLIDYDWLAGAMGWSGSHAYLVTNVPAITQFPPITVNGLSIDPDNINKDAGLFTIP